MGFWHDRQKVTLALCAVGKREDDYDDADDDDDQVGGVLTKQKYKSMTRQTQVLPFLCSRHV